MGQTTRQIEAHIEDTRQDLGHHLDELNRKVRSATDWRHHFRRNPMPILGIAFGGGILLATMFGNSSQSGRGLSSPAIGFKPARPEFKPARTDYEKHNARETWSNIKGALMAVAAARLKDYIGEVVPGFREHFQRVSEKAKANQFSAVP